MLLQNSHNYHLKWLHWTPLNWFTVNCLTVSLLSTHPFSVLRKNACGLSDQKDQLCIWPSFCFSTTLNSWVNHRISSSASSPGKHLRHTLVAISQRDDRCKPELRRSRVFTITRSVTTPSGTQLFSSAGSFLRMNFPKMDYRAQE